MDWLIDTTHDDAVTRAAAAVATHLRRSAGAAIDERAAAEIAVRLADARRGCAGGALHVRIRRAAGQVLVRLRAVDGGGGLDAVVDGSDVRLDRLDAVRALPGRDLGEVPVPLAGDKLAHPGEPSDRSDALDAASTVPHLELSLSLPRETVSVPIVRRLAAQTLRAFGVADDDVDDVQVAITEACANVIKHAASADTYDVRIDLTSERCSLTVVDTGAGFDVDAVPAEPGVRAESGRGLQIMRALVDNVAFRSEPRAGAVVHLVKGLSYDAGHPLFRH